MLAERLGVPQLTFAAKVEIDGPAIRIHRLTDYGHDVVEASLPAVVSVVEKINEPRYPSFKGIMAAKKKPVAKLDLAAAAIAADEVGVAAATTAVVDATVRPPRSAGVKIKDEGAGGASLAEFLSAQKFI
jgi:electron transfer flavoprotein beta subunit